MSDERWAELLEDVGLVPRAASSALAAWHWCLACRLTVRADRVGWWWQAPNFRSDFRIGHAAFDRSPHFRARVRSERSV
jgi:hypothetical protein